MKSKNYWLGRLNNILNDNYELSLENKWDAQYGFWDTMIPFCSKKWNLFTGIELRKGQCVKVKVTQLKNGFKFEVIN